MNKITPLTLLISIVLIFSTVNFGNLSIDTQTLDPAKSYPDLIINGTSSTLCGNHFYNDVQIINGAILYTDQYDGSTSTGWINITANSIFLDSTSKIIATVRGYQGGAGGSGGQNGSNGYGPGGGEGGQYCGGQYCPGGSGGPKYNGTFGSGGGGGGGSSNRGGYHGGYGGGGVILNASSIILNGIIETNGGDGGTSSGSYPPGAGAGGSGGLIRIISTQTLMMNGTLSAQGGDGGDGWYDSSLSTKWTGAGGGGGGFGGNGGSGTSEYYVGAPAGGGGGGRVEIYYVSIVNETVSINVIGGIGGRTYGRGPPFDPKGESGSEGVVYYENTPDIIPPEINVSSPENITYYSINIPLTLLINEPPSWIGYSLDSQTNMTISGNTTLLGLALGMHDIIIYANDSNGNMGASQNIYFTIKDENPPTIWSIEWQRTCPDPYIPDPPFPNPRENEPILVIANISEPLNESGLDLVIFSYRTNEGSWWNTTMAFNITSNLWIGTIPGQLGNATIDFFINAYDQGGNMNNSTIWSLEIQDLLIGDIDGDCDVDIFDIVRCATNYSKTCP